MAIKIGCAAWTWTEPAHNPPYEDAVRSIGELGFDGMELILRDFEDIDGYWTKEKQREIRSMLDGYGMEVSQFAMFQNIMDGLASLDEDKCRRSVDAFKAGCEISVALGCDIVNFVSPWPETVTSVNSYLPEYYYINVPGVDPRIRALQKFQTKLKYQFPRPFDWERYWESHVDAVRTVSRIAGSYGFKLAIENHANTMTPHTDSVLRLCEEVGEDNLGANLDTVWAYLQRENLPWAIYKYNNRLFHVHMRDGDGLAAYNLPVGYGNTDWEAVVKALKDIGYDGYLSLEWAHDSEKKKHCTESLEYLRRLTAET